MPNRFAYRTICRITTIALVLFCCLGISNVTSATDSADLDNEIAFYSTRDGNWEIYTMDADGSDVRRLTNHIARDALPSWSPDGERIAFQSNRDGNWDIYVMNADGTDLTRLTEDGNNEFPSWSPDGTRIVFGSDRDDNYELYVLDTVTGEFQRLTHSEAGEFQPSWSPDGSSIAFAADVGGNDDIYIVDAAGGDPRRLTTHSAWDIAPAWSPDGVSIAFQSRRDGNWNIYVMNVEAVLQSEASDDGLLQQLTDFAGADEFPSWSADGSQIVYESEHGNEEIYVMNCDGSDQHPITQHRAADYGPAWRSLESTSPNDSDGS